MNLFPKISKWLVPERLLAESITEMRLDGQNGDEGICLWLGVRTEQECTATISHLVKLRGSGIRKSPANIQIEPRVMRDVHHEAQELGLILVGQIHSHGRDYGIDLSYVDIKYGVSVPYYLSVVAPDYAMKPKTQWEDCGTHIYFLGTGYTRVNPDGVVSVEPSINLKVITVTNE
jgi:proteasome lid subunit RPN8/RPN11